MTDRDWNWNWNDNWDWLRSPGSGDDSQTEFESSESHEQTQAKTDESTHSQTIHRRALLQTGLVALGFTGASSGGVSAATAPENGDTGKHPAVGAETDEVWSQQQKLTAADGDDTDDGFGSSVAKAKPPRLGDFFIGAPNESTQNGENAGAAYVFASSAESEIQKLTASDGDADDGFGSSIAVSGGELLIGAANDGAVYVFEVLFVSFEAPPGEAPPGSDAPGALWAEAQKLTASDDNNGDAFGESVVISDDGTTAFIGAPDDGDGNVLTPGAVYVFTKDGGTWTETQKLTASDGIGFGGSIAASADGTTALIGSYGGRGPVDGAYAGTAYVFTEDGGTWNKTQKLSPDIFDDSVNQLPFGDSIAVSADGTTALIGSADLPFMSGNSIYGDEVYLFTKDGGTWNQNQTLTPSNDVSESIESITVSADGATALIASQRHESTQNGKRERVVYVFTKSGETWSQQQTLTPNDGNNPDAFGESVVISDDGATALIGAPSDNTQESENAGSAYVFIENGSTPPGGDGKLDLSVQAGTAPPGGTYTLTYQITNTGSTTIGDGNDNDPLINQDLDQAPPGFNTTEGSIPDGGFVDGKTWTDWTIDPGETLQANLEVELPDDIDPGEYEFTIVASGTQGTLEEQREYDRASGTVTVAPLGGARQQKLDLADRIDDAATVDSLLTSDPTTLAIQPDREVARRSLDLLEESVTDGTLSRQTAIDAANRLRLGEQLTEDVLQYAGDATVTTDTPEVPTSLNLAQQTAGPLLKVVVSILLQTKAASKIVTSLSQRLPAGISINPSQIEGVATNLLDVALGFNSETDDVPADAPDTTDPTTLLENLQPEVDTIVEEIETAVDISVDAVLSTIDTVVQPFIDVVAGTLRVFLEHIALAGAVTEGIDAGLAGAVTNLHSALRPASIAPGGLAGSQSQAEEARSQAVADIGQIAIESADVLDGFGTQEKLRDSTELAVTILNRDPEEIDLTTIIEFGVGQITQLPYGTALNLGLGIGFMLNLHASHSNAHTGIINGEV